MKNTQRSRADQLIAREMAVYRTARAADDLTKAWSALERAHIVSQPYLGPHLANHWAMLKFAIDQRDGREISGQLVRLTLAPLGALTGRIPIGNTGRSNVSAFQPMPVPDDLRAALDAKPK